MSGSAGLLVGILLLISPLVVAPVLLAIASHRNGRFVTWLRPRVRWLLGLSALGWGLVCVAQSLLGSEYRFLWLGLSVVAFVANLAGTFLVVPGPPIAESAGPGSNS